MRSLYPNLLSLGEWARQMGLDPWKMAGFRNSPVSPYDASVSGTQHTSCPGIWSEMTFQRNQLARSDVSQAIMEAEDLFARTIGYWPAPKALVAEERKYPSANSFYGNAGVVTKTGRLKSLRLKYGHLIAVGLETETQLESAAAITLTFDMAYTVSISPPKTVPDGFRLEVTVESGTQPDEIHLYYTEADRLNQPREQWEIRPIRVEVDGTTAIITGEAWALGDPKKLMAINTDYLDATDTASYVDTAEVWRRQIDETTQGEFIWQGSGGCDDPPCGETRQTFCASVEKHLCSFIVPSPAVWDNNAEQFKQASCAVAAVPRRLEVNYVAGVRRVNGQMDATHARVIAMLAASLLECDIAACNCTKDRIERYAKYEGFMKDDGKGGVTGKQYERVKVAPNNPFGERHGQARAWMTASKWVLCGGSSM